MNYAQKDHFENRQNMWWACIFVMMSVTMLNSWDIVYTFYLTDQDTPVGYQLMMSDKILIIINMS